MAIALNNSGVYCARRNAGLPREELPVAISPSRQGRGRRQFFVAAACAFVLVSLLGLSAPARHHGSGGARHAENVVSTGALHFQPGAFGAARRQSPSELSLQLEALLGQHSVLAADMMRARLRGDPDFAQAANAALGKNTDAIGKLVRSLFGAQAERAFTSLWATHVTALFNYARGLSDRDDSVRAEARTALATYESSIAGFLASASRGRLPSDTVEAALRTHVEHLLQQADAYAAGDYMRANVLYRQAYTHTFGLGKTLAAGLLSAGVSTALESPEWRLRSEFGRLLGEHVTLVVAALRAGVADTDDFAAAAEAVNANTRDLAGAVDSLFGAAAAKSFQSLWADHIDQLMAYTAGVAGRDTGRSADAVANLGAFEHRLASFLDTATEGRLASTTLAHALLMHDLMLLHEVDALAAKEYKKAHDISYSAYQDMFHLAGQLSDAIGATIASRVPKGGAQTGGGGMAAVVGRR
jgi:hypothetical protein